MTAWKLKNISDAYCKTNEFRHNNIIITPHLRALIGPVKNKSILEVGCGFGRDLEIVSQENPSKLVGCDISPHLIELCKQKIKNENIDYHVLDFSEANSPEILGPEQYDVIYNAFVIGHLNTFNKVRMFMENCYKCLKEGGRLVTCALDIASASSYPEIFKILNFPVKPLTTDGTYSDGCPVEITITEDCILTSYHREFETLKKLMLEIGFKNVKRYEIFLDKIALQAFTKEEIEIYKKSNILLLIEACK